MNDNHEPRGPRLHDEYGPAPPREKIQPAEHDPSVPPAGEVDKSVPDSMPKRTDTAEYVWHYVQEDGQRPDAGPDAPAS